MLSANQYLKAFLTSKYLCMKWDIRLMNFNSKLNAFLKKSMSIPVVLHDILPYSIRFI